MRLFEDSMGLRPPEKEQKVLVIKHDEMMNNNQEMDKYNSKKYGKINKVSWGE